MRPEQVAHIVPLVLRSALPVGTNGPLGWPATKIAAGLRAGHFTGVVMGEDNRMITRSARAAVAAIAAGALALGTVGVLPASAAPPDFTYTSDLSFVLA